MRRRATAAASLAAALAAGAWWSWPALAERDDLALVSRASGSLGQGGDLASFEPAISAGGRAVAFASFARNLSTADDDDVSDVFVRDTATGATTLVSRGTGAAGAGGDGFASEPAISADGRFVAFASTADNLSTADGPASDVFVRDTTANATILISRASGAVGAGGDGASSAPAISADGRFVAFTSSAGNLSAADGTATDVFVRDTATNQTILVSRVPGAGGAGGDGPSSAPAVSGDGRLVVFASTADNLSAEDDDTVGDVFVRDLAAGATTLVSRATGPAGFPGDGSSAAPALSADGRVVAFRSGADNLSAEDEDGGDDTDVFVRDLAAGTTTLVSRATGAGGAGGDGPSEVAAVSGDGRVVAFESDADNLSAADGDGVVDVFVRDVVAGTTLLVSRAPGADGFAGDGPSSAPAVAPEGRFVAFQSDAANLSAEDGTFTDVFLRDLGPPTPGQVPGTGGGADPPAAAPLVIARTSLAGRYTARGLRASLVLRGTAASPGVFAVGLRRTRGPRTAGLRVSASLRLRVTAAGPFAARLRLPATAGAGALRAHGGGAAGPGAACRHGHDPGPPARTWCTASSRVPSAAGPPRSWSRAARASCSATSASRSCPPAARSPPIGGRAAGAPTGRSGPAPSACRRSCAGRRAGRSPPAGTPARSGSAGRRSRRRRSACAELRPRRSPGGPWGAAGCACAPGRRRCRAARAGGPRPR